MRREVFPTDSCATCRFTSIGIDVTKGEKAEFFCSHDAQEVGHKWHKYGFVCPHFVSRDGETLVSPESSCPCRELEEYKALVENLSGEIERLHWLLDEGKHPDR